jgi:hypothetical protein
MKDPKTWLAEHATAAGTLGNGVRQADGKIICHSADESCSAVRMEKILRQFDGMKLTLFKDTVPPRWSTWAFEQGLIRLVARSDGWLFALAVRTESDAQQSLDPLTREFLALKTGK